MAIDPENLSLIDDCPKHTIVEIDVKGQTSNVIRNHLSWVTFEILRGQGEIYCGGKIHQVIAGDIAEIDRKVAYQYGGEMLIRATYVPWIVAETVSLNGQPLPPEGKQIVKMADKLFKKEYRREAITSLIGDHATSFIRFQTAMNSYKATADNISHHVSWQD